MGYGDNIRDFIKLVQASDNIGLAQKALDIQQDLVDARDEIESLKLEIRALTEALEVKEALVVSEGMYWLLGDGEDKDGPYCTLCYDDSRKLMRLQHREGGIKNFICLKCNSPFATDKFKARVRAEELAEEARIEREDQGGW